MSDEQYEYQSLDELADAIEAGKQGPPAVETWQEYDPSARFVTIFPVTEEQGATTSTVAYYIFAPGRHSGLHADNAEEVIYVADGSGEIFVSGKQEPLEQGSFLVVPAGVQHDIYAYGDSELRLLSYFATGALESTFQERIMPIGGNVMTSTLPKRPVLQEMLPDELPDELKHLLGYGGEETG